MEERPGCDAFRAYGDFRDFEDVDGGGEALVPQGGKLAARDPDVAAKVASGRVEEL